MWKLGLLVVVALCVAVNVASAWPGMNARIKAALSGDPEAEATPIGPPCTVGAHNWLPEYGPCPNMPQPPPPPGPTPASHVWPNQFIVQWYFAFVPDNDDVPPYYPLPKTPYNITTGRTYYHNIDPVKGLRNMRESYDSYCIPVFGDPHNPMGAQNDFSCDFINVGETNTSFVVLHGDRPKGAPECCIIGRPFHAPPPNFGANMPVKWQDSYNGTLVDWNAVYDKYAGIFSYGFNSETSEPFAFYMKGVPYLANWMWQRFYEFDPIVPSPSVWELPEACEKAVACPGWG